MSWAEVAVLEDDIKNNPIELYDTTSNTKIENVNRKVMFNNFHILKSLFGFGLLPETVYNNRQVVVYNNEIHMFGGNGTAVTDADKGGRRHYKFDGTSWTEDVSLPMSTYGDTYSGSTVVYNNEIHLLGGGSRYSQNRQQHYKFDGVSWTEDISLPYSFLHGGGVVYNNEIHLLGGNTSSDTRRLHYKFDGTSWTEDVSLPSLYENVTVLAQPVVYNNEIHLLGGTGALRSHYKFDGNVWTEDVSLPVDTPVSSQVIVYNNEIHVISGDYSSKHQLHYKFDGTLWTEDIDPPYANFNGRAVVYDNKIHLLGGGNPTTRRLHYTFDGTSWEPIPVSLMTRNTKPFVYHTKDMDVGVPLQHGGATIYNNTVNIINPQDVFKFNVNDNSLEKTNADIPYTFTYGAVIEYGGEIQLLGGNTSNMGTKWYSIADGDTSWTSYGGLPMEFNITNGAAVVYNGETHLMHGSSSGFGTRHYKYYWGDQYYNWVSATNMPEESNIATAVVYKNEIHVVFASSRKHYKFSNDSWALICQFPSACPNSNMVVVNDKLYLFGSSDNSTNRDIFVFDDEVLTWVKIVANSTRNYSGRISFALNNKIYMMGSNASGSINEEYSIFFDAGLFTLLDILNEFGIKKEILTI